MGIFIVCKSDSNIGCLDDLCLATVEDSKEMQCVEKFWKCINILDTPKPIESNAKCQAFRAAIKGDYPHLTTNPGIWDLENTCLEDLKNFLIKL